MTSNSDQSIHKHRLASNKAKCPISSHCNEKNNIDNHSILKNQNAMRTDAAWEPVSSLCASNISEWYRSTRYITTWHTAILTSVPAEHQIWWNIECSGSNMLTLRQTASSRRSAHRGGLVALWGDRDENDGTERKTGPPCDDAAVREAVLGEEMRERLGLSPKRLWPSLLLGQN